MHVKTKYEDIRNILKALETQSSSQCSKSYAEANFLKGSYMTIKFLEVNSTQFVHL